MRTTYTYRLCLECKRKFSRLTSYVKKKNPRFCSVPCARKYQRGKAHPQLRGFPREDRVCETCRIAFRPKRSSAPARFCSNACKFTGNRGPNAPNWKGGRLIDKSGYVLIRRPEHPRAKKFFGIRCYVREHIVVIEQKLGRSLSKGETVHHINGVKSDNRPENLELRHGGHGKGTVLMCADCGSRNIAAVAIGVSRGEV